MAIHKREHSLAAIARDERFGAPFATAIVLRLLFHGFFLLWKTLLQEGDGTGGTRDGAQLRWSLLVRRALRQRGILALQLGIDRNGEKRSRELGVPLGVGRS